MNLKLFLKFNIQFRTIIIGILNLVAFVFFFVFFLRDSGWPVLCCFWVRGFFFLLLLSIFFEVLSVTYRLEAMIGTSFRQGIYVLFLWTHKLFHRYVCNSTWKTSTSSCQELWTSAILIHDKACFTLLYINSLLHESHSSVADKVEIQWERPAPKFSGQLYSSPILINSSLHKSIHGLIHFPINRFTNFIEIWYGRTSLIYNFYSYLWVSFIYLRERCRYFRVLHCEAQPVQYCLIHRHTLTTKRPWSVRWD